MANVEPAAFPLALITGGSRRVGAATANRLHEAHDILVQTRRPNPVSEAFVAHLNARRTGSARWVAADLDSVSGVAAIAEAVGPRLDLLVLNASRFERCDDAFDVEWVHRLQAHMITNLAMPVVLANRLMPAFAAASGAGGSPCVAWILDAHRSGVFPGFSAYVLSRAAGAAAISTLAHAMAPNVRVVGVAPGTVLPSTHPVKAIETSMDFGQRLLARGGTPEDVAAAVSFVAQSPFLNGTIIDLDGGRRIWPSSNVVLASD